MLLRALELRTFAAVKSGISRCNMLHGWEIDAVGRSRPQLVVRRISFNMD